LSDNNEKMFFKEADNFGVTSHLVGGFFGGRTFKYNDTIEIKKGDQIIAIIPTEKIKFIIKSKNPNITISK